ncbi:hypothetical protein BABINDRAFT_175989 [Babjeviella inositovora NRRL Y-12698]|uniref:Copper transporter n=1 Tax=Babjeviella inositovora NRRL Y-12698 TaxID=984486 RepID=A0A1E3QQ79_9ASCO|nr:uncharacterized protein BABINDRAFT_175989 [Babjeviella inositovora NRRL Y-12698]ODQ79835.1 hypothetical protein BABINDRAFT_175989 [Babjeviella inositovora NRRL Y-12698]
MFFNPIAAVFAVACCSSILVEGKIYKEGEKHAYDNGTVDTLSLHYEEARKSGFGIKWERDLPKTPHTKADSFLAQWQFGWDHIPAGALLEKPAVLKPHGHSQGLVSGRGKALDKLHMFLQVSLINETCLQILGSVVDLSLKIAVVKLNELRSLPDLKMLGSGGEQTYQMFEMSQNRGGDHHRTHPGYDQPDMRQFNELLRTMMMRSMVVGIFEFIVYIVVLAFIIFRLLQVMQKRRLQAGLGVLGGSGNPVPTLDLSEWDVDTERQQFMLGVSTDDRDATRNVI